MESMEKRRSTRHPFTCDIECPLESHATRGRTRTTLWRVIDVSAGGIGVVASEPADLLAPVQVRFRLPGTPALISSLMQVQWIQQVAVPRDTYRLGLSYLV